jgi:hypothetical protein
LTTSRLCLALTAYSEARWARATSPERYVRSRSNQSCVQQMPTVSNWSAAKVQRPNRLGLKQTQAREANPLPVRPVRDNGLTRQMDLPWTLVSSIRSRARLVRWPSAPVASSPTR